MMPKTEALTHYAKKGFAVLILGGLLATNLCGQIMPQARASRLKDLIKKAPELYLPSQLLPNTVAKFTVKGQPGQKVLLMLSTQPQGYLLPNGMPLKIGEPNEAQEAVIPETGVVDIEMPMPDQIGEPGLKRFIEAVLYNNADMSDAQVASAINPETGLPGLNAVAVGAIAENTNPGILPGDAQTNQIFRSLTAFNEAQSDDRKKKLLDDGKINRDRANDQTYLLNNK